MQVSGEGIILRAKPQGKGSYWLCVFSQNIGKVNGFISGSYKAKADFQVGNVVEFTHTKRLDSQLGSFYVDVLQTPSAQYLNNQNYVLVLQYLCDLHEKFLPEEEAFPVLYEKLLTFIKAKPEDIWHNLALYEAAFLKAMGYGLSLLEEDAVRGEDDESPLLFVSPKSGRAVSAQKGLPYKDKMLVLPHLFGGKSKEMLDLFNLTGHFLQVAFDGKALKSRLHLMQIAKEINFGEDEV